MRKNAHVNAANLRMKKEDAQDENEGREKITTWIF